MSTQTPARLIKPVAPTQIGDRIRLTDEIELEIRRIVQEELREFMLEQRRAALYINSFVERRLRLTT